MERDGLLMPRFILWSCGTYTLRIRLPIAAPIITTDTMAMAKNEWSSASISSLI